MRDVLDDLVAPVAHEIDVDVRRREAFKVEEPLEDKPVLQRVDIGEPDRVVHHRTARRSADRGKDPLLVREPDEVLDDEDVSRVAGLGDDRELLVDALTQLGRGRAVLLDQARLGERSQLLLRGLSRRHLEVRKAQLAKGQLQVDFVSDPHRVFDGLGVVREELAHLCGGAHEELGVVDHLQTVGRVDRLAALDADHGVLRLGVVGVHVVDVVGHDERNAGAARDLADTLVDALLLGDPMRHELEVVVALAEDRPVLQGDGAGRVKTLIGDGARELALQARGERDQPLAALPQQVLVHARAVVVALDVRRGDEGNEVLVAGEVLRKEDQMPGLSVAFGSRVAVEPVVPCDVGLDADDRFDARVSAKGVKVDRAVEGSVVGERERRHIEGLGAADEIAEAGQPVEQAVLAMRVQMDEVLCDDPAPRTCRSRKRGGLAKSSWTEYR